MASTPNEILSDLTLAASLTRKNARAAGRYARTPKFETAAAKSSRPSTGAGVTFHFAHKALSKRSDISEASGTMTSASAHQGYIERKEAGAQVDAESAKIIDDFVLSRNMPHQTDGSATGETEKTQEQHPSERDQGLQYQRPEMNWSQDRMGFGTLGKTPAQRKEFWQKVERSERRSGRVQSRIIAELPHEATPKEHRRNSKGTPKTLTSSRTRHTRICW